MSKTKPNPAPAQDNAPETTSPLSVDYADYVAAHADAWREAYAFWVDASRRHGELCANLMTNAAQVKPAGSLPDFVSVCQDTAKNSAAAVLEANAATQRQGYDLWRKFFAFPSRSK